MLLQTFKQSSFEIKIIYTFEKNKFETTFMMEKKILERKKLKLFQNPNVFSYEQTKKNKSILLILKKSKSIFFNI